MTDAQQDSNESRPLLPRRNFNLDSWFARWPRFTRGRASAVDVESSSPSHDSGSDIERRLEPGPSLSANVPSHMVPPAPPNTPPEPNAEVTRLECQCPPESSSMGGEGSTMRPLRCLSGSGSNSHSSNGERLCLICLEPLLQEEFDRGIAMVLECDCKGDTALRHKSCAQRWVNTKGDLTCDICRAPIRNLDAPQPRSESGSQQNSEDPTDASRGRYPSATDVFDCIRMTWVVTIVCILFFDLDITSALVTGLLIAVMYTWSCQLLRCAHHQVENAINAHAQDTVAPVQPAEPDREQQPIPAAIVIV